MTAICFSLLSILILLRHVDRSKDADEAEQRLIASNGWPAVDIFIVTYNEPLEVLEKAILAATAIDYPCATVWVCDDTRRVWLRDYCAELGVRYISRPDNVGAKAGNLNHALAYSRERTNAPVILVLDADFVAKPKILRRTVGMLEDPGVAIVQTPQFYYNSDPIQHNLGIAHSWIDDQRFFFDVFQPAKDAWGCAFCVGTSFVARRDRLEEVGGFPDQAITEDIHLTYRLLAHGYATRWLNERLSIGLSAEGLPEYIGQRSRWCLGTIQVALLRDGPFRLRGLTFTQRWHYAHGMLNWLSKPFLVAMLVAPAIYWFGDVPAFNTDYASYLRYGVPALLCLWCYNFWVSGGRTLPFFTELTEAIPSFAVCATLVSAVFAPFGKPFKVTDKGGNRSEPKVRWTLALSFASIAMISAAGILWSLFSPNAAGDLPQGDVFNLMWAAVAMVISFGAFLVCFERGREEEVLFTDQTTSIEAPSGIWPCRLIRLSISRAVLQGLGASAGLRPGDKVRTFIPHVGWIGGEVGTPDQDGLRIELVPSVAQRKQLILHLFTSGVDNVARQAVGRGAIAGLLQHAFRPSA
jgi:cellulose synthase (UDP-forming)